MQNRDEVHWPKDVPGLSTARLRLRAVDPVGDAAAMLRLLGDPEVTRYTSAPRCTTLAQARAALEQFPQRFAAKEMIRWAIQPLGHSQAIGTVGLLRVSHQHRRGEPGYDLARRWWGRGLAPEAAAAVVAWGLWSWGCTGSRRGCWWATMPRCGCWRSWGSVRKAPCATTSGWGRLPQLPVLWPACHRRTATAIALDPKPAELVDFEDRLGWVCDQLVRAGGRADPR